MPGKPNILPVTALENAQNVLDQGLYLETGMHISLERNFVCSWRRHNCRSQVIDLSLSALIS
jgi:hypothetical protein